MFEIEHVPNGITFTLGQTEDRSKLDVIVEGGTIFRSNIISLMCFEERSLIASSR